MKNKKERYQLNFTNTFCLLKIFLAVLYKRKTIYRSLTTLKVNE